MDIPIDVDVYCADGQAGRTRSIVLNPVNMEVTHIVISHRGEEYLVPLDQVYDSTVNEVHLRCTVEQLQKMERFVKMQFLEEKEVNVEEDLMRTAVESDANYWPYLTLDDNYRDVYGQVECVPHNELTIHRGAKVQATDGHIGQVDEFIVDPTNYHISHLMLRTGHLWGKKDITIPISEIDRIEEDVVFLKLDKKKVKALPSLDTSR